MMAPDIPPFVAQEAKTIALSAIGERFAPLRIADPVAERVMLYSMQKYGQLTPLVICRIASGEQELLDGFKRLRAGRQLGIEKLAVRNLDVSLRTCKAEIGRAHV